MYDLRELVTIGASAKVSHRVVESDAATDYSQELRELLSTPAVIGLAIKAAAEAVDRYLPEGYVSIGRYIEFEHTASTRVGMQITLTATVTEVQPLYIILEVRASDEQGEVGFGMHKRSIVVKDYLMARSKRREALVQNSRPI